MDRSPKSFVEDNEVPHKSNKSGSEGDAEGKRKPDSMLKVKPSADS